MAADSDRNGGKPCRMVLRSKDGVELYTVAAKGQEPSPVPAERPFLLKGMSTLQQYTPDGSKLYVHQQSVGVSLCPLDGAGSVVSPFLKGSKGVQMLAVSPKGTYLLTWERFSNDLQQPNLKVWNGQTGDYLCGFVQKNLKRYAWPYLQWSHDEKHAFLMVQNEIRIYPGDGFGQEKEVRFTDKMRCQGLTSMSVPQTADGSTGASSSYLVATFVSKTKDKPARASLHRYPSPVPPTTSSAAYPSIMSKSLFQADEVGVHWSPKGDAALMAIQTSVDTSGESYYGSTSLYLMHRDSKDVTVVDLPNNSSGPVSDVAWMPNPDKPPCFAVVSGKMPAMASLHHGVSGAPIFLFGNAHRNTISWSTHGRFVCLAGFGNLAGGMAFWDRNKQKPIPQYDPITGVPSVPQLTASCTVGYGWSPDSRLFAVSTTTPRMNVDNGIKVFRYNGEELAQLPWDNKIFQPDRLLQASFVPSPPEAYPDRAQSPPPRVSTDPAVIAEAKKKAAAAVVTKPASAGRYVPPSARGRSTGGTSLAERLRREKEESMMGATAVTKKKLGGISVTAGGKKLPVGMTAAGGDGQGKSKSAQRRERQKANKAKMEQEEAQKKAEEEAAKAAAAKAAAADPEKRARKIRKTLKQIDELKTRDPTGLNDDQKKKMASEDELRAELAKLGV